jgi:hypothetical protein
VTAVGRATHLSGEKNRPGQQALFAIQEVKPIGSGSQFLVISGMRVGLLSSGIIIDNKLL